MPSWVYERTLQNQGYDCSEIATDFYDTAGQQGKIPQQGSNPPLWVTTSTSLLKSHTGATQALTRARERCFVCSDSKFVHLYCYFSVFGLWHKADFAHF